MSDKEKVYGAFRKKIQNVNEIKETDMGNPYNFFAVLHMEDVPFRKWMYSNNLIYGNEFICPRCPGVCTWRIRVDRPLGGIFMCKNKHFMNSLSNSFFEGTKFDVRDVLLFIKLYLDGLSLKQVSIQTTFDYKKTAVQWATWVREVMVEYVWTTMPYIQFTGTVEIDESLFGRRVKHHRGASRGCRVWIFGLLERESSKIVLYPVEDRSKATLIPLIKRHVRPGGTIYSDGWSSYLQLNDEGFQHFVVNHKTNFTQQYQNTETGETVQVHTNRIEGAWKHCKEHFKRMNGVRGMPNFESHLCEVIYRNHKSTEHLLHTYLNDLRTVYHLGGEPSFQYRLPIFNTMNADDYSKSSIWGEDAPASEGAHAGLPTGSVDDADMDTQAPDLIVTSPITEVDGGPPSSPVIPLVDFPDMSSYTAEPTPMAIAVEDAYDNAGACGGPADMHTSTPKPDHRFVTERRRKPAAAIHTSPTLIIRPPDETSAAAARPKRHTKKPRRLISTSPQPSKRPTTSVNMNILKCPPEWKPLFAKKKKKTITKQTPKPSDMSSDDDFA